MVEEDQGTRYEFNSEGEYDKGMVELRITPEEGTLDIPISVFWKATEVRKEIVENNKIKKFWWPNASPELGEVFELDDLIAGRDPWNGEA